ncbi:MAG: 16S rRNA (adenine(1518)-N(6)/adenine(1519)-N(6))-dimethyltransferase RsmA [Clostridia bacterium]|nr:16S rRNA (adenine(1518)-N(6)/adenine(1519)-N(6))-dimethyltransferase RsmA [Clostridia bacterium]
MENILEETRFILKKYNIRANKNLGQNFLIDKDAINKIVDSADITDQDLVIEIGPGLGTLTEFLLEKAKKVICIELDTKMINILEDRFMLYKNLEIINEDVLKIDLKQLIKKEKKNNNLSNVKIVANLPYYITTPIVMKLLEEKLEIESITIMIQKEVADRLIEIPGGKNSGAITYSVNYYAIPEAITEVPNTSFIPEPEVTSKVIKLVIRKNSPIIVNNEELMFKIIKSSFMQRRKTLLNALVNNGIFKNKEDATKVLKELNFDINVRGEKLTLEDYAKIANILSKTI